VSQALTALLARLGLGAVNVSVIRPADATLVGSALAALTSTAPVHRRA
jgi:hypothetical protein